MAFTALAAGVSGLQAFTEGVGVIADNITNVNTIGYKETRSRFSTLVTETAALSSYSPGGVRAFSDTLVSKQGLLQPSGSATDLSIDGAGFFVVRSGARAEDTNGEFLYTRAGAFNQDDEGFFKNTAGLYLMGWPTDSTGAVSASNQSDLNELRPININNLNGFGAATGDVSLRVNLDTDTAVNSVYDTAAPGDIADGTVTADFETNITIYDSQGRSHLVNVAAVKTGVNTWNYEIYFDDDNAVDSAAHPDGLIASGQLKFNDDGSINLDGTAAGSTMLDSTGTAITFPGDSIPITYATANGTRVEDGEITFDFGDDGSKNGFVQSSTESARLSFSVDGAAFGNINGVEIGEDGIVTALFDNGLTLSVYKLPIAVFQNPDGLGRRQGNAFGSSDLSGEVNLQHPGESGAGKVAPNSLEQSTVDLASEFAELIKVQRAFSASTRIITTSDQILEELTRL
ncbi:flagellar hook protein FlgE [Kordiimonas gwangyangensis]|uniref:flagellar hook protein FlgE n=1 Tax=Kordiimonas gwangyangensis TaxID=288022 RepID=UPI000366CF46|nr:flagellar hook protein FlgE [Kordiimonas gwangyangensis]